MVQAIIFDLGGVLLDIDVDRTWAALAKLGFSLSDDAERAMAPGSLIDQYERGLLSTSVFLQRLQQRLNPGVTLDALEQAVCALLLGISSECIAMLNTLSSSYRLFLLSNTNALHVQAVNQQLQAQHGIAGLHDLFESPYYSYEMGARKPELSTFQQVIDEQQLTPEHTLFVDDLAANTQAAAQCGLQVWHKPQSECIVDTMMAKLACLR